MSNKHYIIGIGNPDRGDDGVGRYVAAQLQDKIDKGITVVQQDGEIASLLLTLQQAEAAWLIDASCSSSTTAGTIQRFDAAASRLPQLQFNLSTHGFGLAEAIELARATNTLPTTCIVYAIEGHNFDHGEPISDIVLAAAHQLVDQILGETYE
jgi:hydrogenase maturation protease